MDVRPDRDGGHSDRRRDGTYRVRLPVRGARRPRGAAGAAARRARRRGADAPPALSACLPGRRRCERRVRRARRRGAPRGKAPRARRARANGARGLALRGGAPHVARRAREPAARARDAARRDRGELRPARHGRSRRAAARAVPLALLAPGGGGRRSSRRCRSRSARAKASCPTEVGHVWGECPTAGRARARPRRRGSPGRRRPRDRAGTTARATTRGRAGPRERARASRGARRPGPPTRRASR